MADEKLMTVGEFNAKVRVWTESIKVKAFATLSQTRGNPKMSHESLSATFRGWNDPAIGDADGPTNRVHFGFHRHGVYRSYGAGRGYVIINGVPVRGYRVRSDSEIRKKTMRDQAFYMLKDGYTLSQVNRAKKKLDDDVEVKRRRTPLNWLDAHIDNNIGELADVAQEFYGDLALQQMMENLGKIKIVK
ncbi:MAG: hypothetical protein IJ290_04055 [Bacteroidaceae bacterium]|nr:hypothetical protein [Bacteroidaceae bacterium]